MKKKIMTISLCVALVAVAIVGGTLAYFTDTDAKTNTFTVGNVAITLSETDNQGEKFVQNQKLLPGSQSKNAIAKNAIVTVNKGSEDSWVWVELLIPAKLYGSKDEKAESYNALHYNQFKNYLQGYTEDSTNPNAVACAQTYKTSDHQWSLMKYIDTVEIDGNEYARLRTTHKDIVKAEETTSPAFSQFYMDSHVYTENGKYMIPTGTLEKFEEYDGPWEVIVNAYAIQAAGIDDVDTAVATYNAK